MIPTALLDKKSRTVHQSNKPDTWFCLDLDVVDYREALAIQHNLVEARKSGALTADTLIVLEHQPVFTLGRRGGRENLLVSSTFLDRQGVQIVQVERGGNITYHGPGQLVVYAISNLHAARTGVDLFVHRMEEVMIRIAKDWHITAVRNPVNRGVWVGHNKLGAIGIAIRRGITFHGLALNAAPSLEPFSWINPCGLQNIGVTSMERETEIPVAIADIRSAFKHHFAKVFQAKLESIELQRLESVTHPGS